MSSQYSRAPWCSWWGFLPLQSWGALGAVSLCFATPAFFVLMCQACASALHDVLQGPHKVLGPGFQNETSNRRQQPTAHQAVAATRHPMLPGQDQACSSLVMTKLYLLDYRMGKRAENSASLLHCLLLNCQPKQTLESCEIEHQSEMGKRTVLLLLLI